MKEDSTTICREVTNSSRSFFGSHGKKKEKKRKEKQHLLNQNSITLSHPLKNKDQTPNLEFGNIITQSKDIIKHIS